MKTVNITRCRRMVLALAYAILIAIMAAGCGGGERGAPATDTAMSTLPATTLNAVLNGAQEVPPTASTASGTATVTVDAARTTINLTLNTAGLVGVTASHIHSAIAGVNGGVIFSLFAGPGVFPATLTKTLTSAEFTPDAASGVNTFADAVNAILAGRTYINVHTMTNLGGEIRGQIMP